jgi:hypothetical protein
MRPPRAGSDAVGKSTGDDGAGSWNMPHGARELSGASDASRGESFVVATEDRVNVETRRHETDGAEVVNTTRARQGVTGHNVRYVLTFGIAGVVILFALAYLIMH